MSPPLSIAGAAKALESGVEAGCAWPQGRSSFFLDARCEILQILF